MWKVISYSCLAALAGFGILAAEATKEKPSNGGDSVNLYFALQPIMEPENTGWVQADMKNYEGADQGLNSSWKVVPVGNETIAQKYISSGKDVMVFRPYKYRWYFYRNGKLLDEGIANGGKDWCPDIKKACRTPSGVFKIYKEGSKNCVSSKFPLNKSEPRAPMPYCMFLQNTSTGKQTGLAIHGSKYINPSRHGSHGCIRVQTDDAGKLSEDYLNVGTVVVITNY